VICHVYICFVHCLQMQAQAQRNNQANQSQHSLFSQASAQQAASSGSAQSRDQQVRPPAPCNQGQKSQVSSSPQAFAQPLGSQAQNNMHYLGHGNPNQNPNAKGVNAMLNQSPRMNSAVSLQTTNMHPQATQFQQSSQQLYGTSNPSAQAYPRPITGSTPLRSIGSVSETQPSLHPHGTVPAKMGTPPSHPTMQHNVVQPMLQKKGAKANALTPGVNAKQDSESAGKACLVGTGNASAKGQGKQVKSSLALCHCTVISTSLNIMFHLQYRMTNINHQVISVMQVIVHNFHQ
jgi:transcription initiation factor TFIID subunit 4